MVDDRLKIGKTAKGENNMRRRLAKLDLDPKIKPEACSVEHYYGFIRNEKPFFLVNEDNQHLRVVDFELRIESSWVWDKMSWRELILNIDKHFDETHVFDDPQELYNWMAEQMERLKH